MSVFLFLAPFLCRLCSRRLLWGVFVFPFSPPDRVADYEVTHTHIYIIYTANIVLLSLGTCRFETNPFFSLRRWHGVERSTDLTDLLQSEQLE